MKIVILCILFLLVGCVKDTPTTVSAYLIKEANLFCEDRGGLTEIIILQEGGHIYTCNDGTFSYRN